jgi:hypothetical protein
MRITELFDKLGWEYSQPCGGVDIYSLHGYHIFETANPYEWIIKKDGDIDFDKIYDEDDLKSEITEITREIKTSFLTK